MQRSNWTEMIKSSSIPFFNSAQFHLVHVLYKTYYFVHAVPFLWSNQSFVILISGISLFFCIFIPWMKLFISRKLFYLVPTIFKIYQTKLNFSPYFDTIAHGLNVCCSLILFSSNFMLLSPSFSIFLFFERRQSSLISIYCFIV